MQFPHYQRNTKRIVSLIFFRCISCFQRDLWVLSILSLLSYYVFGKHKMLIILIRFSFDFGLYICRCVHFLHVQGKIDCIFLFLSTLQINETYLHYSSEHSNNFHTFRWLPLNKPVYWTYLTNHLGRNSKQM